MRIGIVGATGLIGRRLTTALGARGHTVVAVSRRGAPVAGAETILRWNPAEGAPPDELHSVDAVVNLAGESLVGRWSSRKKAAVRESRVSTTQAVSGIVGEGGPGILVNASAVGVYGDRGDSEITESTPPGEGFLADVCRDWEAATGRAAERGARVVLARIGLVLAREGGALPPMARATRFGLGGPLGGGRQFYPWVHIDDVTGAIAWALETSGASGPVNVTAPEPVRQRDLARALGHELHRPAVVPALRPALRLLLGEAADLVLMSQRVRPVALAAAGYRFATPDLRDALQRELSR